MKTRETKLGTALRFIAFLLYELGEIIQRAGDILGDAGDAWDRVGPAIHRKARRWKAGAGDFLSRAGVTLACCLSVLAFALALLWSAIKERVPRACRWGVDQGKRAWAGLCALACGFQEDACRAWAFRAALIADAKGAA